MTCRELIAKMLLVCVVVAPGVLLSQENKKEQPKSIYENSLHFTSRGLKHWYAKENGGVERITGVPFESFSTCNGCHVSNCDTCHAEPTGANHSYTVASAKSEAACAKCHGFASVKFAKEKPQDATADVHFAKGMKCMDCHTSREIHGDGTAYVSMEAPGALDAKCENCHKDAKARCASSSVHGEKLDCGACHTRNVTSCHNCHLDTRVKEGKSVSLPMDKTLFLVNQRGKVKPATMLSFIYQGKTFISIAPAFSHWVSKQGRRCDECHGTENVKGVMTGTLKVATWEKSELKTTAGVVPVLDGYDWKLPFLNYSDKQWLPAEHAAKPLLNYAGYAEPMTKEQVAKMAESRSLKQQSASVSGGK